MGAQFGRTRQSGDTFQTQSQQQNGSVSGSNEATFNSPSGQSILQALTRMASGGGDRYTDQAGATFGNLSAGHAGINPNVEDIIRTGNQEGDRTFANRLAQVRAGGYRGGTAAALAGQGGLASDFTNKQAENNANLRYGAYNDSAGRDLTSRMAGASGLAGLANQNQNLGTQLLQLLRGSQTIGTSSSSSSGVEQGKTSGTGSSSQFSFNPANLLAALAGLL